MHVPSSCRNKAVSPWEPSSPATSERRQQSLNSTWSCCLIWPDALLTLPHGMPFRTLTRTENRRCTEPRGKVVWCFVMKVGTFWGQLPFFTDHLCQLPVAVWPTTPTLVAWSNDLLIFTILLTGRLGHYSAGFVQIWLFRGLTGAAFNHMSGGWCWLSAPHCIPHEHSSSE